MVLLRKHFFEVLLKDRISEDFFADRTQVFAAWKRWAADSVGPQDDVSENVFTITLKDGTEHSQMANSFRGKADNPMSTEEVEKKARDLIEPAFGAAQTKELIETVRDLETVKNTRDLRRLLAHSG